MAKMATAIAAEGRGGFPLNFFLCRQAARTLPSGLVGSHGGLRPGGLGVTKATGSEARGAHGTRHAARTLLSGLIGVSEESQRAAFSHYGL